MKKHLISTCLIFFALMAMAQKKELKQAEKDLKKQSFSQVISSLNSIESTIANADDKYKAKYYFLKGQAFVGMKDYKNAAKSFNDLTNFETKIGKKRYSDQVRPMLNKMIQDVSQRGIKLYNSKKYKQATEDFYTTYLLSPKDTTFLFNAAMAATQAKDLSTSLKYYKKLVEINYTGIATSYTAINKKTKKKEFFNSKSQRDLMIKTQGYSNPSVEVSESKKASIVKNIAYILSEQGKVDEAIEAFEEARKSDPKDVNLILNEANLYVKLKKMDRFGKLMEEAVKLNPNDASLYFNLGVVNYGQKRMEQAKKYYKKAIELKPDYADAYMNLAVIILDKEKEIVEQMNNNLSDNKKFKELEIKQKEVYREALPYLEKADKLNRSIDTVRTLLNLYGSLEMDDKAKEYQELYKAMK